MHPCKEAILMWGWPLDEYLPLLHHLLSITRLILCWHKFGSVFYCALTSPDNQKSIISCRTKLFLSFSLYSLSFSHFEKFIFHKRLSFFLSLLSEEWTKRQNVKSKTWAVVSLERERERDRGMKWRKKGELEVDWWLTQTSKVHLFSFPLPPLPFSLS